ncbi:hypothetical protein EYC84_005832 [Monilinia fructicola]|uniref:Uncharacterized protein n=1 Tax=Monilinia fructicola TaxID=38448 RepID=A0A5M9K0C8_MONFR|nr:hypothetical protein EYC84_005832 [Monilinia fructicola]
MSEFAFQENFDWFNEFVHSSCFGSSPNLGYVESDRFLSTDILQYPCTFWKRDRGNEGSAEHPEEASYIPLGKATIEVMNGMQDELASINCLAWLQGFGMVRGSSCSGPSNT